MGELRKPRCIWSLRFLSPAESPWTLAAPETCPELPHICSPEQWDTSPAVIITYSSGPREQESQGDSRRTRRQGNAYPGLGRDAPAWHILWDLTEGSTVNRFPSPLTPSALSPTLLCPRCLPHLTVRGQRSDLHRFFFLHEAGHLRRKTGKKENIPTPKRASPAPQGANRHAGV